MHEDDWLEAAYEDRWISDLDTWYDDANEDNQFDDDEDEDL